MHKCWINFYVFCLLLVIAGCGPDGFNPSGNVDDELINVEVEAGNVETVAIMTWETAGPAVGWVEFTDEKDGDIYYWQKRVEEQGSGLTTHHEVIVFGMVQGSTYYLRAVSETKEGRIESVPYKFETGSFPLDIQVILTAHNPELHQKGLVLASLATGGKDSISMAVIFNENGEIIWWFDPYNDGPYENIPADEIAIGHMSFEVSHMDGKILFGGSIPEGTRPVAVDLAGRKVWEGVFGQVNALMPGALHHTMYWTDEGMIVGLALHDSDEYGYSDVLFEVDPATTNLLEDSREDVVVQDVASFLLNMGPYVTNSLGFFNNAISFDKETGTWYYNNHQDDSASKINANGNLDWIAGGPTSDFTLNNEEEEFPKKSHGLEYIGNDTLLYFDNAGPDMEGDFNTRVVKIQYDENDMTAEIVWQYPEPSTAAEKSDMETPCGGDADQLEDGNVLVATGIPREGFLPTIFEVTPDHEIVWEITATGEETVIVTDDKTVRLQVSGFYAADKIPNPTQEIEIE